MTERKQEIFKDAWQNLQIGLPIKQIADLHQCSRQYVYRVLKGYGIKADKQTGILTIPVRRLPEIQKIFPQRTE